MLRDIPHPNMGYTEDSFGSGGEHLLEVTGKVWWKTSAVPQL